MKRNTIILLTILIMIICIFPAFSENEVNAGEIMKKHYNLKEEENSFSKMTMVLIDDKDQKKTRKLLIYKLKTETGMKTYAEFVEPADVKGTKFLSIETEGEDDDQRIYFPALKKIKKISASGKGGKFMGSDLFYYDLENKRFEDGTYSFIKTDTIDGKEFWVIEIIPVDKEAPYSKTNTWIRKDNYFMYKVEAYDKKDKLLKTIVSLDVKEIGGILKAGKMAVENHKDKHKSLIITDEIVIDKGIDEKLFSIQNLSE